MTVYREREVTRVVQDGTGVDVHLSGGQRLRAEYLVGCDGGRSAVRKSAGIDFPGWDPTMSYLLAEVELAVEPEWGIRHDAVGVHALSESTDGGSVRVMVTEQHLVPAPNQPWTIYAKRWSPSMERITESTAPLGFPGQPT